MPMWHCKPPLTFPSILSTTIFCDVAALAECIPHAMSERQPDDLGVASKHFSYLFLSRPPGCPWVFSDPCPLFSWFKPKERQVIYSTGKMGTASWHTLLLPGSTPSSPPKLPLVLPPPALNHLQPCPTRPYLLQGELHLCVVGMQSLWPFPPVTLKHMMVAQQLQHCWIGRSTAIQSSYSSSSQTYCGHSFLLGKRDLQGHPMVPL